MRPTVTIRRALEDPALLGLILAGPSWLAWRTVLIAAMGEPLISDEERDAFRRLTGRGAGPLERVDELWAVIGRRGGKSRAAAVLVTYLAALVDHAASLAIGERGLALFVAENTKQARSCSCMSRASSPRCRCSASSSSTGRPTQSRS